MHKWIFLFILHFTTTIAFGQTVYKTPSGSKYHTSTCRFVKNVSTALNVDEARAKGLSPCSVCKPSSSGGNLKITSTGGGLGIKAGEASGISSTVQCKGKTKTGSRCKRMTKNVNGYCFQHEQ